MGGYGANISSSEADGPLRPCSSPSQSLSRSFLRGPVPLRLWLSGNSWVRIRGVCYAVSGVRYQELGKKLTLVGDGGARDG